MESDAVNVISAIKYGSLMAVEGPVVEDIWSLLTRVGCEHCTSVTRHGNRVAHCLANLVCFNDVSISGCTFSFRAISPFVSVDIAA
ncbi:hypothetical protein TIFTF001_010935 [Ficus carica]|uniref:Uncharacterized protein n=1 Tax=Ficus carica TaxID=3494 RepID=A0AA88D0A8_FICCA|nr:hypothetical protein TIFTF001_010935 [Ficus carica]